MIHKYKKIKFNQQKKYTKYYLLEIVIPVSYTHLDVYKRQSPNPAPSNMKNCPPLAKNER